MNACSHLFVCKGVNQQRSSKCSSVSCNCCVLDCSSEFFCTYVGQSLKCLGLSFSFSVLGCCGGWWLFVGAGMEGPFFATGPVAQWMWHWLCNRRVRPWTVAGNGWRFESSLDRVYFGAQVFSGEVLWSWGGFWPFMNIWQKNWCCHILPSSPSSSSTTSILKKDIKPKGAPYEVYNLQEAPTTNDS